MKKIIIRLLEVLIIIGAGYFSLIVMFIGGISQIIHSINPFIENEIVIGILKIIFCELPIFIGVSITYFCELKMMEG